MVKNHSDSNRKPTAATLTTFSISSKGSFICTIPNRITHTSLVTPVVEHRLEQQIAQWIHHEGSNKWPITPQVYALPQSYISLSVFNDLIIWKVYSGFFPVGKYSKNDKEKF